MHAVMKLLAEARAENNLDKAKQSVREMQKYLPFQRQRDALAACIERHSTRDDELERSFISAEQMCDALDEFINSF